ncbi:hypothetical protein GCM10027051_18460 [Niabella terrae]
MYSRKTFLSEAALAATALFISSMDVFAKPLPTRIKQGYSLKIMAPFWGFEGSITAFCKKAKDDGYDGVEIIWLTDKALQEELFAALKTYQLEVGFLCRGDEPQPEPHFNTFKKVLHAAIHNDHQLPLYINVHSGRDYFSLSDNQKFIDHTLRVEQESNVPVYHETHRSRMLYSAPASAPILKANRDLRLTLDISHWCNVSESLLEDQQDTVALALNQTAHIHSRVGHAEGPQVSDPRAPEWKTAVAAHFAWWDTVVEMKKQQGQVLTMLTEFGPAGYMPTLPYTNQPVADQWEINTHMMQVWKKRYL